MRLLITGAGGFVGRRAVRAARADSGLRLRLTTRTGLDSVPGAEVVRVDLARPQSLRGLCDGVDAVLHCASLIGGDEAECMRVNALGTCALIDEAERAGVRKVVYVSTAAVCGRGPFVRAHPDSTPVAPVSPTSRSRAVAEARVLRAGGTVVRPDLVYGVGDRHVVPALVHLYRAVGARAADWSSLLSLVDVDDLARILIAAVRAPAGVSGVRHVNHPDPVRCSIVMDTLAAVLGLPPQSEVIDLATARRRLAHDPRAARSLDIVGRHRWFAGTEVWNELDCVPGLPFQSGFSGLADAYSGLV